MADNRERVVAPKGTPHRFGLLSVADITEGSGHWLNGILFEQVCGTNVKRAYVPCQTPPDGWVKEPADLSWDNEAEALALYAMVDCGMIGGGLDAQHARDELEAGEGRALEVEFALAALATSTSVGTTTDAVAGVAALLAAWDSGIEPTLHLSPNVALLLGDRIVTEGTTLRLRTGEKVSVGYGYAEGGAYVGPDVGAAFITGPVFGFRSAVLEAGSPRIVDNANVTLAERAWLIASLCDTKHVVLTNLLP